MTHEYPDLSAHDNAWIRFQNVTGFADKARKTYVVAVINRTADRAIGRIKWYNPWRQYCFLPEPETIFNTACMKDIVGATAALNASHKAGRKQLA